MVGLGEAEGDAHLARQHLLAPLLLVGCTGVVHHQHAREIADDGRLVLQVVVQAESLGREVLADDGHAEVRAVGATERGGKRPAEQAGGVGAPAHLAEQRVPLGPGHAAVVEVGPGELSSMVEEADVVVALFEGPDLRLDEGVDPYQ